MQGIEILVVTLAAFFGLGIFFAILLWCRSWQREHREQSDRQFQSLRALSDRLRDALDMLDHTAASLQTVDGQLTRQLEDLRSSVQRLQNVRPGANLESADAPLQNRTVSRTHNQRRLLIPIGGARIDIGHKRSLRRGPSLTEEGTIHRRNRARPRHRCGRGPDDRQNEGNTIPRTRVVNPHCLRGRWLCTLPPIPDAHRSSLASYSP